MLFRVFLVLFAILTAASLAVYASQIDPIPVLPGSWHSKVTTSGTGLPQPIVKEDTQCVDKTVYDPEEMIPAQENCKISNVKQESNYLEYSMTCNGGPQSPPIKAHVVLRHKKKSYEMTMNGEMEVQGQKYQSKVEVVGTYKGECAN